MMHRENARKLLDVLKRHGFESVNNGALETFAVALSHSSYANEMSQSGSIVPSNERLEFLGDAVLDLVVADHLYNRYELSEGRMSVVKATVVSEASLASVARNLGLKDLICLGKGEERTGGREKNSILADAFEALVGAIYIVFGWDRVKKFILSVLGESVRELATSNVVVDYKTALQELTQSRFKILPEYRVVASEGPSHARRFTVEVWLQDDKIATASGKSKKEAQQKAAKIAYEILKEREESQCR
ncbi:MAG: ribonuclease III [Thermotogae bacterium]|nr:ribonuclease III [Thermotogota bacterium]